jgi:hypothetical protein
MDIVSLFVVLYASPLSWGKDINFISQGWTKVGGFLDLFR